MDQMERTNERTNGPKRMNERVEWDHPAAGNKNLATPLACLRTHLLLLALPLRRRRLLLPVAPAGLASRVRPENQSPPKSDGENNQNVDTRAPLSQPLRRKAIFTIPKGFHRDAKRYGKRTG